MGTKCFWVCLALAVGCDGGDDCLHPAVSEDSWVGETDQGEQIACECGCMSMVTCFATDGSGCFGDESSLSGGEVRVFLVRGTYTLTDAQVEDVRAACEAGADTQCDSGR